MSHFEIMLKSLERHLAPKPPTVGFNPSISPEAALALGYIIAQWGMFDWQMSFATKMLERHPNTPKDLVGGNRRPEFIHRARHIKALASHVFKDGRENAVKYYHDNIDKALLFKDTRDTLAHGTFASKDNEKTDGIVCHYKSKNRRYSLKHLIETGHGIGRCTSFLLEFDAWNQAPQQKASLEKLHEQGLL